VTLLFPVVTTLAIVSGGFVGFATLNCPVYGAANVKGAGDGATLNIPEAVKVTWPLGNVCASAVGGVTVMEYSTRPEFGSLELQDEITVAKAIKKTSNPKARWFMNPTKFRMMDANILFCHIERFAPAPP
jgi:hypothetical protein